MKEIKRVRLKPDTDLLRLLEEVHTDRIPRLLEREGEALAVVMHPDEYVRVLPAPKSKLLKKDLLALAGAWSDLDAERLIDYIYKARHEAPPSHPVSL